MGDGRWLALNSADLYGDLGLISPADVEYMNHWLNTAGRSVILASRFGINPSHSRSGC